MEWTEQEFQSQDMSFINALIFYHNQKNKRRKVEEKRADAKARSKSTNIG